MPRPADRHWPYPTSTPAPAPAPDPAPAPAPAGPIASRAQVTPLKPTPHTRAGTVLHDMTLEGLELRRARALLDHAALVRAELRHERPALALEGFCCGVHRCGARVRGHVRVRGPCPCPRHRHRRRSGRRRIGDPRCRRRRGRRQWFAQRDVWDTNDVVRRERICVDNMYLRRVLDNREHKLTKTISTEEIR